MPSQPRAEARFLESLRRRVDSLTFYEMASALVFLTIALTALLMPAQNDTWWQLRAGQEAWRNNHVLLRETFSHTAYGAFWPNHEWLSQVLLYALYATGGLPLMTIVAAAVVVGAWLIVWRLTPGSTYTKFLLVLLAFGPSTMTSSLRPQVFSIFLLVLIVALLRTRQYMWLPLVFLVWANLHGAVVMGVVVLGAGLAAAYVEDRRALVRLTIASVMCILATLATPLGLGFWPEIATSLGRIRRLNIQEWSPPGVLHWHLLPFWLTLLAFSALLVSRGRALVRDPYAREQGHITLCVCALALVPLALTATRNVPPFLMLAVPAIAALKSFTAPVRESNVHPRLNAGIVSLAGIVVCSIVGYAYVAPIRHMGWVPFTSASFEALRSCRGNLYNRYDEGGYLIWFAPEHRVFLDGRQDPYPEELIYEQERVEHTGEFASLFRQYDVHCAFVPPESLVSQRLMQAGWTPLYRDNQVAVLAN